MAGGIFGNINKAMATGQRNYPVDGLHRFKVKKVQFKEGTAKNSGKEFFICEGEYVVSSEQEKNTLCRPGSSVSISFNTRSYPDSAAADIKAFLLTQFTEEELAAVPRSLLRASEVQPNTPQNPNPYINGQVGITWAEALQMVAYRGDDGIFKDRLIDIEVVTRPNKTREGTFTKVYFKRPGSIESLGPVAA